MCFQNRRGRSPAIEFTSSFTAPAALLVPGG
jgi:hypothetical protein